MLADYPIADSLAAGADSVAPGAGATVVSIAAPPKGIYEILAAAAVGAGAVAADNGNVKLLYNGATQINGVPTVGIQQRIPRVTLDGTNAVTLAAIGAATAAVVYTGEIILTRIG